MGRGAGGQRGGGLLVLGLLLAAHLQQERDCAIDLVLEGREVLRIAAIQRQRHRLLSERTLRAGLQT